MQNKNNDKAPGAGNRDQRPVTPIYIKADEQMPWPSDPVFYLLSADNLYLCRNHRFFRSCVPAPRWPTELAAHGPSLRIRYPRIPQRQFETVCGFFEHAWWHHGSEAIALLACDGTGSRIEVLIPEQVASVSNSSGGAVHAIGVKYRVPRDLPEEMSIYCSLHSHADMPPYCSAVDQADDRRLPGLHIVVGNLHREPPQLHAEMVIDHQRFTVAADHVIEGYARRRADFPPHWLRRLRVVDYETYCKFEFSSEPAS